jgi:hypothetical protein
MDRIKEINHRERRGISMSSPLSAFSEPSVVSQICVIRVLFLFVITLSFFGCSVNEVADSGSGTNTGNAITAVVHDPDGKPAWGAVVRLRPDYFLATPPELSKRSASIIDVIIDSTGIFNIGSINPGSYFLEIQDIHNNGLLRRVTIESDTQQLELPLQELKPNGYITGTVVLPRINTDTWIQIYGLERLARINKTTGTFTFNDIPEASLTFKTLSITNTVTDQEIEGIVNSGDTTVLDTMIIPEDLSFWRYSSRITINTPSTGAGIQGDVTGFPLLVRLNSSSMPSPSPFDGAQGDGADIRFTNADGTPLPYDIERWDSQQEQAEIWVKVDVIRGNNPTQYITMYWGQSRALTESGSEEVFSFADGYAGVWHLDEIGSGVEDEYRDRTGNRNHGKGRTLSNTPEQVEGMIGHAQRFDAANVEGIDVEPHSSLDMTGDLSISFWLKLTAFTQTFQVVCSKRFGDQVFTNYQVYTEQDSTLAFQGHDWIGSNYRPPEGSWIHATFVVDDPGDKTDVYVNGIFEYTIQNNSTGAVNLAPLTIGYIVQPNMEPLNGTLDELRIAGGKLGRDWIKLSYETQKSGSNVVSIE